MATALVAMGRVQAGLRRAGREALRGGGQRGEVERSEMIQDVRMLAR